MEGRLPKQIHYNLPQSDHTTYILYTDEPVDIVGECKVAVRYGTQKAELTLMVVSGSGPSLLEEDWQEVNNLNASDQLRNSLRTMETFSH